MELHFIWEPTWVQATHRARWGVGSNCWLFSPQGRQAAYGVPPVTQMVNFHQLFCSVSNSGIRRDRFFTIPSSISPTCFPSLCFCSADSLSAAWFCWGGKCWAWDWAGFSCFHSAAFKQDLRNRYVKSWDTLKCFFPICIWKLSLSFSLSLSHNIY